VLSKPALTIGAAALSLVIELVTIFILVCCCCSRPKMRRAILGQMKRTGPKKPPGVAGDVNRAVTGYMLGTC